MLREVVRTLDQVVDVDYYLPGCPPTPKLTKAAVGALLSGNLPPKGTVLAPDIALCDECPRKDSKPTDLAFTEFKRPHQAIIDPEKCILAQGFICMGPATRGGCEAVCVQGNMPCTGCFGPTSRVKDQGAKILSSVASNVEPRETGAIDQVLDGHPRSGRDVLSLRPGQVAAPRKADEAGVTPPSPILDRVRNGPPSSGGGLARLFRLRLGAKLELSFLLIIIVISLILSLVGTWVIGDRFVEQAQEKVGTRSQLGAGDLPEQPAADQRRGPVRLGPGLRPLAGDGRRPGPAAAPALGHLPSRSTSTP